MFVNGECVFKKVRSISSEQSSNLEKVKIITELRRTHYLPDLLIIAQVARSIYYYYFKLCQQLHTYQEIIPPASV